VFVSKKMRVTYKFYLASIFIGIASGFTCVAFRSLIHWADNLRIQLFRINDFSDFQRMLNHNLSSQEIFLIILKYLILFLLTSFFLNVIYRLVKKFPTTSGSGLPQTKALLEKKMEYKTPLKNIIAKFTGGVLSISSGLSFGREGSSVQMGSLIGFIFGKTLKVEDDNRNYLIAAGAGAGISAAFTAPLASYILILESLRNDSTANLNKLTISTLLSGLCAGIIAIFFFPTNIYSSILIEKPDLKEYQILMIFITMAVLFSILGKFFSKLLIFIKLNYPKFQIRFDRHYLLLAAMIVAITFFYPSLVGGNQIFTIEIIESNSYSLLVNLFILTILATLTIVSNATGFPGGIFIPLLSIGGLIGKIFCIALAHLDILSLSNTGYFVFIGMSVFFISVVRTPLTGFILISEMTGNYDVMFPTLVVGILTYVFTEIMKVRPLDNILYDLMMRNRINTDSSCS
jgi:H+/Cl- antiporter ClcA